MKSYLIILSFHLYITNFSIQQPTEETLGYRVINIKLLEAFLVNTVICKFCESSSGLQLWETPENVKIHGWSSDIGLECKNRKPYQEVEQRWMCGAFK